jgi:magnesium-transporting ATPase (P-type)
MLWINIIMDSLGGLAFAGEPPHPSCMKERPKKRDEPILCAYMVNQILILGGFTILLSLFFLKSPFIVSHFRPHDGNLCLLTAFFAFFIFTTVFNCFNARTDRLNLLAGITGNRPFTFIMLAISVIQIGFVYLGGSVLRTVPLHAEELTAALFAALLVFPAEFLRKLVWKLLIKKPRY